MNAHRYKTWGEAAGLPETSVRLGRLPDKLDFPDDFPEPIHFDPKRKRLCYRGFMTSNSYRFLHNLTQDPAYLDALDYLYQQSSYAHPDAHTSRRAWLWAAGVAGLSATGAVAFLRRLGKLH